MASISGYRVKFSSVIAVKELVTRRKLSRDYVDDISIKNENFICVCKNEEKLE